MKLSRLCSFIAALSLALPLYGNIAQAAPEVEFNFQTPYTGPHTFILHTAEPWAKEVFEKSNGSVLPHIFMDGTLNKSNETIAALLSGTLDMGGMGVGQTPEHFPLTRHIAIPFAYETSVDATAIIKKVYAENEQVRAEVDKIGKVVAMWGADRSAFFSTTGPITSPDDLKGKRVLVWGANQVEQVKAWGGVPVQVTPPDTYIGLQRGMGEIFLGPLPTGTANKLMEVAKDVTPISAMFAPLFAWVSWDLWNYFTPEQQKLIEESTQVWSDKVALDLMNVTNADIETMKANGCTFYELSPAELQVFKDRYDTALLEFITREMKRTNVDKDPQEWIDYIFETGKLVRQ